MFSRPGRIGNSRGIVGPVRAIPSTSVSIVGSGTGRETGLREFQAAPAGVWTHAGHPDDGIQWRLTTGPARRPTSPTARAQGTRARAGRGRWAVRATAGPDTSERRGWPEAGGSTTIRSLR